MNSYENLVNSILNAPFWIQEALFFDLQYSFEQRLETTFNINTDDIYTIYIPEITFNGKRELETRAHGHNPFLYKCLQSLVQKKRVVDIAVDNFWSLEEASKYISECIANEYVKMPQSDVVSASIFYMSGEIRLGEYAKRTKLIDITQLDHAMRVQKEKNAAGVRPVPLGEVLVSLGFLTKEDIAKILLIKDDSRRRFIASSEPAQSVASPAPIGGNNIPAQNSALYDKLVQENEIMKEKLRAIVNILSKKQ